MFYTDQIIRLIRESAMLLKHDVNLADFQGRELSNRLYAYEEQGEFERDLVETANTVRLMFLEYSVSTAGFADLLKTLTFPVLVFRRENEEVYPEVIYSPRPGQFRVLRLGVQKNEERNFSPAELPALEKDGNIHFYAITAYDHLVSEPSEHAAGYHEEISPSKRLFRLLNAERKDIFYILFYAVLVGLISLIIPLGIQTTTELVSGGVFFSSIYILIALIIIGVFVTGVMQIFQITMVEYLQRRIFTKAAYEFAFRLPRMRNEALTGVYPPELVNRFFDVMTIQKGLPKLLIDLSSALLQIFFGLVLVSLYHPFFVFFGIILIVTLVLIFTFTGPPGVKTSIKESTYKYKLAYWLQELGRSLGAFKLAGNTNLPIRKTDYNVNNYLKYRKKHFAILIGHYSYIVVFKTAITAAMLIMGTILVVDRQITLGQYVASEVIIILILASVEKFITYIDVVYDLLTAVDKIGHVTDVPLEKSGGVDLPATVAHQPFHVKVHQLNYKFPKNPAYTLTDINLSISAGERVCLAGPSTSGKSTLTDIMSGLRNEFEGAVTINGFSVRDLDLTNLRDRLAKNISREDIFEGSIMENLIVGKAFVTVQDAIAALEKTGLIDWVNTLPEGLNAGLISGGKGLSSSVVNKLILARCLAKRPSLLILNDFFFNLPKQDKLALIQMLVATPSAFTLVVVSNDPIIMAACDRVILMRDGRIAADGKFEDLLSQNLLTDFTD
jgi:ABC-type bacteriocin/lantibiotic exporter with double-glycine peptidase domain